MVPSLKLESVWTPISILDINRRTLYNARMHSELTCGCLTRGERMLEMIEVDSLLQKTTCSYYRSHGELGWAMTSHRSHVEVMDTVRWRM